MNAEKKEEKKTKLDKRLVKIRWVKIKFLGKILF